MLHPPQPRRNTHQRITMDPLTEQSALYTRRQFFSKGALGLGTAALSNMLPSALAGLSHYAPKAKRVIYLFQNGAPSHVDLFDHKPALKKWHGKEIPKEFLGDKRFSTMTADKTKSILAEITKFKQHGQSGAQVSSFLPYTASIADKLCFIKSMHTTQVNHAPAITFFLTGGERFGRPSIGSWLSYGLGSMNQELPTFVAMTSVDKEASCGQMFYDSYWGSGFLPSVHQGVKFRGGGDPVLYLENPTGINKSIRRKQLDAIAEMNQKHYQRTNDQEIITRIAQYEMAYKMQTSVPELTDLSKEPKSILHMYGPDVNRKGSFAYNCIMARRLAERGTRFIQLMHAGWDQHNNLNHQLKTQCIDTDQPSAALIKDLEMRGMLDETLVIWGGEFGRTPFLQGNIKDTKKWGRDHHPYAFTIWMAGGGVKPGITYGATDEFGCNVTQNPVHVHDFQATLMHLLGLDHEKLTYKHQGRNFRLTDVHGHIIKDILT